MRVLPKLARLVARPPRDPRDALAALLVAAKEDPALSRQLLALLQAPALQRASILNTALHEMELRGEPAAARAVFAVLASESGAAAALRALTAT